MKMSIQLRPQQVWYWCPQLFARYWIKALKAIGIFNISLVCLTLFAPQDSWALTVKEAKIVGDAVLVRGGDSQPNAIISWIVGGVPEEVAQADAKGNFRFLTDLLPLKPKCIAELFDGFEFLFVQVENCQDEIVSFYSALQDKKFVPPGQFDSVRSHCDLGDWAVNGGIVLFPTNHDFEIGVTGLLIDGSTGQQSWLLQGTNVGTITADIRVNAICADTLPLH